MSKIHQPEEENSIDHDFGIAAIIPREILLNRSISSTEKLLYAVISGLCRGKKKQCFASNAHFSELLGVSTRSVQRELDILKKKGLVICETKKDHRGNDRRYIRITWKKIEGLKY